MSVSRRNVLIGLGSLVAGGGAILGTGAFTSVQAERTVNVETAGDASAFLGFSPASGSNGAYAEESDGLLQINLDGTDNSNADGLNQDAITRIEDIVETANNGSQAVTVLTFEINVSGADQNDGDVEDAFSITSTDLDADEDVTIAADGNTNILDEDVAPNGNGHDSLDPGEAFNWGISIDLLNSGVSDISGEPEITLTITAEA
jgi:hypothetical protein